MTEIEIASFVDTSAHWVKAIAYSPEKFVVYLHPCHDESSEVKVAFTHVSGMQIDTSHNDEEITFPWDIIGYDSEILSNGQWEFVLHTDMVEFSFQATWPTIERQRI